MGKKRDLQGREDIEHCMKTFYGKLLEQEEFHHLFVEIAAIDLDEHLPIICDFWEGVLFHTGNYRRNTLQKHLDLHARYPLREEHFTGWLSCFYETVDDLFAGPRARYAKERALSVATVIRGKIMMITHKIQQDEEG